MFPFLKKNYLKLAHYYLPYKHQSNAASKPMYSQVETVSMVQDPRIPATSAIAFVNILSSGELLGLYAYNLHICKEQRYSSAACPSVGVYWVFFPGGLWLCMNSHLGVGQQASLLFSYFIG